MKHTDIILSPGCFNAFLFIDLIKGKELNRSRTFVNLDQLNPTINLEKKSWDPVPGSVSLIMLKVFNIFETEPGKGFNERNLHSSYTLSLFILPAPGAEEHTGRLF
jgi:hypothetical protein